MLLVLSKTIRCTLEAQNKSLYVFLYKKVSAFPAGTASTSTTDYIISFAKVFARGFASPSGASKPGWFGFGRADSCF